MNYARFFNRVSAARQPSAIRVLTEIVNNSPPSLISMAGGVPNVETFPIKEASFTLTDGSRIELDSLSIKRALQYSATAGFPEVVKWLLDLQKKVHNPPNMQKQPGSVQCLVTNGSQEGLSKAFEMFATEGDNILVESPSYSGTLAILKPLGCNLLPVKSDGDGLDPNSLYKTLSKWKPSDAKDPKSGIPKVLYCIPNGGNPTGAGLPLNRKKEIYEIAREYDLMILEDDPYFFIQFNKPYIPSLLSLDDDGRVLRFDSLSKLMSSGMRVGFVTGPKPVVERILYHQMVSSMHVSGLSQIALLEILNKWGHDGFLGHATKTADFYQQRRDQCLRLAEKHLTGLAEWTVPSGGMFLWLKLNVQDTYKLITIKAREKEVLFVPGNAFMIDSNAPCQYIRASYSSCSEEQMDTAFSRLASLLREESS